MGPLFGKGETVASPGEVGAAPGWHPPGVTPEGKIFIVAEFIKNNGETGS